MARKQDGRPGTSTAGVASTRKPAQQVDHRRATGQQGEALAVAYLAEQGYGLEARNWRTRGGEIDIVARDGAYLVFVEVRARTWRAPEGPSFGPPEESVTAEKQRRLVTMAEAYLFQADWRGPWRVDVLALELRPDGSLEHLRHYRDAVQG